MARPEKKGLEYFNMDVSFFTDIKIRKLIKYQSGKAVTIYAYLLCTIYQNGYYILWDEELPFIISEVTGFDEAYICEAIKCCMNIGLFDKYMFENNRIITSKSIQERFNEICRISKRNAKVTEYNLIYSEETCVYPEVTIINSEESTQSKVKERKEKKTKVNKDKINDIKEEFEIFWDSYHSITGIPKTDKDRALGYYKKLTAKEREKALSNIQAYFGSLNDKKYCKKCRTYLSDKNFNDEFSPFSQENGSIILGPGEWIENGKRYYGSKKQEIPLDTPPRPGEQYYYNLSQNKWLV